ncbi:MAG TPA: substrate-binding domain-containing protein, partial [Sphaerochaeta sp.]|nr:substrate-binding domain-containing protein [Sphaerochaeta sp.]
GTHDGIFCYCDDIAAGAIRAIRKHDAPIRVIGFDGVRATDYLELSTVSQEPQMIGELASTLIIDLIEGKRSDVLIQRVITPVLIDRGS